MKCIVIGAAGQVGLALMKALRQRKHQALGIDRLALLPEIAVVDASDIVKIRSILESEKPDWVYYPAGFSWVDGCEQDPLLSRQSNVECPLEVARVAGELGAGFTYFSSEYIFDGQAGPYTEDSQPCPVNVYGRHKLEAEQRLPLLAQTLIVRTTVVYGPEIQRKNFVCQVIDKLKNGLSMAVPVDQISSPTYNVDLASACVELAERSVTGTLNLAGPDRIDRYSFSVQICDVFDLDINLLSHQPTSILDQMAIRPLSAGLDSSQAYELLKTRFRGIRDGLIEMRRIEDS